MTASHRPRATTSRRARPTVRADRFGRFAAVPAPDAGSPVALAGHQSVTDGAASLGFFDPSERPSVAEPIELPVGEHLAPLLPPVISAPSSSPARQRLVTESPSRRAVSLGQLAAPASAARTRVRLTLRGRLLVVGLLAAALGGFSAAAGAGDGAAATQLTLAEAAAQSGVTEIVVLDGDTIASIAQRVAPTGDVAAVAAQIQVLNDLDVPVDSPLQPGSVVLVPVLAG